MTKKQKEKYRLWLCGALVVSLAFLGGYLYWSLEKQIPDQIILYRDQTEELNFSLPFGQVALAGQEEEDTIPVSINSATSVQDSGNRFSLAKPIQIKASETGSFRAKITFFGWIPYKYIEFDVAEEATVTPMGNAVGLYIHSDGLMVLGTGRIAGKDGFEYQPAYEILQSGDYILAFNGKAVDTIDMLSSYIQKNGTKRAVFTVKRGENKIKVRISPVLSEEGEYQIGAWLREDTEGIGTLTFVDEKGQFAALGHGITDADTGMLIQIQNGGLYPAEVRQVVKGETGVPGELVGSVALGDKNRLGMITNNTSCGIVGKMEQQADSLQQKKSLPLGRKQKVKKGSATILCQLGDQVKEYEIEIEEIDFSSEGSKSMKIHVTDEELLKKAGGIVQGMSGAPIIQNGTCIGAVTHVFVRDVTRGYGIFIENMMAEGTEER